MKNTIDKHELTDEQIAACKGIEKAFKKARKLGLSFLAKQVRYMLTVQNL